MPYKPDFDCTAKKLQTKVDAYFSQAKEDGKKPTIPGLCRAIGLRSVRRFNAYINAFNNNGEENLKDRPDWRSIQYAHAAVLADAQMRMTDMLEQGTGAMDMFRLKQPIYGGYSDKAADGQPEAVRVVLQVENGMPKGVDIGG